MLSWRQVCDISLFLSFFYFEIYLFTNACATDFPNPTITYNYVSLELECSKTALQKLLGSINTLCFAVTKFKSNFLF